MRIATVAFLSMALLSAEAAFEDGEKRFIVGDVPEHTTGAYRPFTIPGEIAADDGMVEFRKGRGIAVWCPEKVAKESPRKAEANDTELVTTRATPPAEGLRFARAAAQ